MIMLWFVAVVIVVLLGLAWYFKDNILEFWKKLTKIWKATLISIILLTASLLGGSYLLGGGGGDNWLSSTPDNSVALNEPSDEEIVTTKTVDFKFTPVFYQAIQNASLHVNETNWNTHNWNTTAVANNTENTISYTFSSDGTYKWNVEVFNSTGSQWDSSNQTVTVYTSTVTLNSPADESSTGSPVSFTYTPTSDHAYEKAELFFKAETELSGDLTTFSEAGITAVAYGDVNNDGENEFVFGTSAYNQGLDPELVVYEPGTNTTTIVKSYTSTREIVQIKIVDFDNDGDNDVLYGTTLPARQCFIELNSDFSQKNYGYAQPVNTAQVSKSWGHDDWDNDGVDEVIVTYCGTGNTYIVDGNYTAGFSMSKVDDSGYVESGEGIICYDVDSDGKKEVFVSYGYNTPPSTVTVHIDFLEISTSLTVSSSKTVVSSTSYSYGAFGGRIGDLDGNGAEEFMFVWCETDRDAYIKQYEFESNGDIADSYHVTTLDCNSDAQRGTTQCDYDDDGRDELIVARVDSNGKLWVEVFEVSSGRAVTTVELFTETGYETSQTFANINMYHKLNGTVAIGICDYTSPPSSTDLIGVHYRADLWMAKKLNQTSISNDTSNTIQYSFNWSDLEWRLPLNFTWNINVTDTIGNTFASSNFTLEVGIDETNTTYDTNTLETNTTKVGQLCQFHVICSDDSGLSGFILESNNTGTLTNETFTTFASLGAGNTWANKTLTLNDTIGVTVQWKYYFNDASDNWNNTMSYQTLTVVGHFDSDQWNNYELGGVLIGDAFDSVNSSL